MTVSCFTRLIDRKLARLVVVRDSDSSSAKTPAMSEFLGSVTGLEVSSAHIERLELAMLTLGDSAIRVLKPR